MLSGLPGDQGLLNVQAYIPSSTQGLSWHITSKPDWLALSTMQGSTSAALTYHVSPEAPRGATGYIQLDTDPSYAAPSVKSGPLSVRFDVTAPRVPAGVLLAGGTAWGNNIPLDTAEIWDPTTGASVPTRGPMTQPRQWHTATALPNGQILLTGGLNHVSNSTATTELFDPATGLFTAGPTMASARTYHTATLLHTGQVLIAGGIDHNGKATGVAEVYDPASHRLTRVGDMLAGQQHTATLLGDGRVLITGGTGDYGDTEGFGEAEIYDPASATFTPTGTLHTGRYAHTATLLSTGQVLVSGGANPQEDPVRSAELYTPATRSFTETGSLDPGRRYAASVLLPDHDVLLVGGHNAATGATLYEPTSGHWRGAPHFMVEDRDYPTAVVLSGTHTPYDGTVFVAGGVIVNSGSSRGTRLEVYDPTRGTWRDAGRMSTARAGLTATLFGPGVGTTSATVSQAQP
jgi:hypothetical protein